MSGIIGTSKSKSGVIGKSQDTAKAWVNFNGTGTVAIRDSFNVSSITDNSVGQYDINFASAMTDTNFSSASSADNGSTYNFWGIYEMFNGRTTAKINVRCFVSDVYRDPNYCSSIIFGD